MKLLLLGPLPPPIGGATVLFKQLIDGLSDNSDIELKVIDTSAKAKIGKIKLFLSVLFSFLKQVKSVDVVSFHASLRGALLFSPFIFIVCKYYSKPWVFRGFGGNYPIWYQGLPRILQWLLKSTLLSADVVLLETKESVGFFSRQAKGRVIWYPNSRKYSSVNNQSTELERLVYVSQIKPSKGIYVLLEAMRDIEGVYVDCYGPLSEGVKEGDFNGHNVNYKGVLNPDEVSSVLARYDALVFPTFYDGEGYPGVILESYCEGLPVITTNWRCIPELVDDSSGKLVEPENVEKLREAIIHMSKDEQYFLSLKEGAIKKAEFFAASYWENNFLDICRSLIVCDK